MVFYFKCGLWNLKFKSWKLFNAGINDIKDTTAKDKAETDQKLGQINQDMNDLNGAMKMRVKVLADDLNDTIKDLQSKNETSLQGDFLIWFQF